MSGGSGGFWLGFYLRKHSWVFNVEWCVGLYANDSVDTPVFFEEVVRDRFWTFR